MVTWMLLDLAYDIIYNFRVSGATWISCCKKKNWIKWLLIVPDKRSLLSMTGSYILNVSDLFNTEVLSF